jgi:hypothetical protein
MALGCFASPSRLVKDCEYTAERALSSGSSDGAMPAGRTNGSKLMSVAALVSSGVHPIEGERADVHACAFRRPRDRGASCVGSPG